MPYLIDQKSFRTVCLALLVFILTAALFCSSLGRSPFSTRGEGREAQVVTSIIDHGSWILPLRNGSIPSKPPLFHWLGAAFSKLAGSLTEGWIRLPSALCSALALALVSFFVASAASMRSSALTVLITMTAFEWTRSSSHARVDMCFTAFLTIGGYALFCGINRWREMGETDNCWLCAGILGLTGAALTKGPAALVIPWTVVGTYLVITADPPRLTSVLRLPFRPLVIAFLLSLLLPSFWYWFAYLEGGEKFFEKLLLQENWGRVVQLKGYDPGHRKPFFFSIIDLAVGFLPWSLFFPVLGVQLWNKRRELLRRENSLLLFSLIWIGVFLLAVTASSSKRTVYLLPVYPQLAFLLALSLEKLTLEARGLRIAERLSALLLWLIALSVFSAFLTVLTLCLADIALSSLLPLKPRDALHVHAVEQVFAHKPFALVLTGISSLIFLFAALSAWQQRLKKSAFFLALAMIVISLSVTHFIFPAIAQTSSPREFINELKGIVREDQPLYQFRHSFYPAVYYARRLVPTARHLKDVKPHTDGFLLVKKTEIRLALKRFPGAKIVHESRTNAANGKAPLVLMSYSGNQIAPIEADMP